MLAKVADQWKTPGYSLVKMGDQWHATQRAFIKVEGLWRPYYTPTFSSLFSGKIYAVDYVWAGNSGRGWGPFGEKSAPVGKITPNTFRGGASWFSHVGMFDAVRNGNIPAKRNLELSLIGGDLRALASPLCKLNGKIGWLSGTSYYAPGDNTYLWYTFAEDVFFSSDEIGEFEFSF